MRADPAVAAAEAGQARRAFPGATMPAPRRRNASPGNARGPWAPRPESSDTADAIGGLAERAVRTLAALRRGEADAAATVPLPSEVQWLCNRLVRGDAEGAADLMRAHGRRGENYSHLSDGLLADAARRLGAGWDTDSLSVVDVTVAVATLMRAHAILRSEATEPDLRHRPRVLFVGLCEQAHTLGILLAAEAFRRDGWDVSLRLDAAEDAAVDEAGETGVALVGLSAGRAEGLDRVCGLTERLRRLPDPPGIMVGGPACSQGETGKRGLAADCVAARIEDALCYAREVERRLC